MADQSHLDILAQGVETWNSWRKANAAIRPDLSEADLEEAYLASADLRRAKLNRAKLHKANLHWAKLDGADLSGADITQADVRAFLRGADLRADLSGADLSGAELDGANLYGAWLQWFPYPNSSGADLSGAKLRNADLRRANLQRAIFNEAILNWADFSGADLYKANLSGAHLFGANLSGADLRGTDLEGADFTGADLSGADLEGAYLSGADFSRANLTSVNLSRSVMVETILQSATLAQCRVYGISAWNLKGKVEEQKNLVISPKGEPIITADDLEVAQFIYLLLKNEKLRQVIDTITSKVVLILGRFTSERKVVLEAIRGSLRQHDYLPVLFDFDKPASRDLTETISTLAHMARFIIADITEAKSIPQELQAIVPNLPSVPVQPLLLASEYEYGMFEHFKRYPWVLEVYCYDDPHEVLNSLEAKIISPAKAKAKELSRQYK